MRLRIGQVTCGVGHAKPGDPKKVAKYHAWLRAHPGEDMDPIEVFITNRGQTRIWEGRHRFCAYLLAGRETIPAEFVKHPERS